MITSVDLLLRCLKKDLIYKGICQHWSVTILWSWLIGLILLFCLYGIRYSSYGLWLWSCKSILSIAQLSLKISLFSPCKQRSNIAKFNHWLPEIRGLLDSALQKSSCKSDHFKERLFVCLEGVGDSLGSSSAFGTSCNCFFMKIMVFLWS